MILKKNYFVCRWHHLVCWSCISSDHINVANSLNRDILKIQSWCLTNGMKLNPHKTHSITISQSRLPHFPFTLCGLVLEVSSSLKWGCFFSQVPILSLWLKWEWESVVSCLSVWNSKTLFHSGPFIVIYSFFLFLHVTLVGIAMFFASPTLCS